MSPSAYVNTEEDTWGQFVDIELPLAQRNRTVAPPSYRHVYVRSCAKPIPSSIREKPKYKNEEVEDWGYGSDGSAGSAGSVGSAGDETLEDWYDNYGNMSVQSTPDQGNLNIACNVIKVVFQLLSRHMFVPATAQDTTI